MRIRLSISWDVGSTFPVAEECDCPLYSMRVKVELRSDEVVTRRPHHLGALR